MCFFTPYRGPYQRPWLSDFLYGCFGHFTFSGLREVESEEASEVGERGRFYVRGPRAWRRENGSMCPFGVFLIVIFVQLEADLCDEAVVARPLGCCRVLEPKFTIVLLDPQDGPFYTPDIALERENVQSCRKKKTKMEEKAKRTTRPIF